VTNTFEGYEITFSKAPGAMKETWELSCKGSFIGYAGSFGEAFNKANQWAKEQKAKQ
jgi:hypothetical protein